MTDIRDTKAMNKDSQKESSPISEFRKEIEIAINSHCLENGSDTPDFILAEYLIDCLRIFDKAVNRREIWYGRADI